MEDFEEFDESPLDILDGDGDDAVEMCLFFDEDGKSKNSGGRPPSSSGCCVVFLAFGSSVALSAWGIAELLAV